MDGVKAQLGKRIDTINSALSNVEGLDLELAGMFDLANVGVQIGKSQRTSVEIQNGGFANCMELVYFIDRLLILIDQNLNNPQELNNILDSQADVLEKTLQMIADNHPTTQSFIHNVGKTRGAV